MVSCGVIAFQDFRDRAVQWFLFPILGIVLGVLHLQYSSLELFLLFSLTNILLVSGVLIVLFLYTKQIMKSKFLNVSFGLGDALFFYALSLGFPTITFVLLFVGSILFSLLLFLFLKKTKGINTVPLAGLMGLFLIGVFVINLWPNMPSLYII